MILKSKLPNAKKFRKWVTSDILPSLRKNGSYDMVQKTDSYMIDDPAARARRWAEEYEEKMALEAKNAELEAENVAMKPKAAFYDQVGDTTDLISVSKLAALFQKKGLKINQNILFEYLRQKKFLCSAIHVWNKPSQKMLDSGIMDYKMYIRKGGIVYYTPQVTGVGQQYLFGCVEKDQDMIRKIANPE